MAAPQVNLETYSSREYTCSLTLPDITYGTWIITGASSTVTGADSHSIQFVGTRAQVNADLIAVDYVPAADLITSPFNVTYLQTDDEVGSATVNGTMQMTIGTTHSEHSITASQTLSTGVKNLGSITDLRPDNVDSNIQYTFTLTFDEAEGYLTFDDVHTNKSIIPSDTTVGDLFGGSVSIAPSHGTVIVGAEHEDTGGLLAGAAYIFTEDGSGVWTQQQKIQSSDIAADDYFGISTCISADGNHVIVGAESEEANGSSAGAAYYFTRTGSTWTQQQKIVSSDIGTSDFFGNDVAMSFDGTKAVIAARGEGAMYYFTRTGSTWTQQQKIVGGCYSVDMDSSGVYIIAGSITTNGTVRIYKNTGSFTLDDTLTGEALNDQFGWDVAISGDSQYAIVGARWEGAGTDGAAYMYVRSGSTWSQQAKFTGTGEYGYSVSMDFNGNTAIAGNYITGLYAEVYERTGSTWVMNQQTTSGQSVDINSDGTTIIGGESDNEFAVIRNINTSGTYSFTGTKTECNGVLDSVFFTSLGSAFTMVYAQTQDTDSKDHGSQNISFS